MTANTSIYKKNIILLPHNIFQLLNLYSYLQVKSNLWIRCKELKMLQIFCLIFYKNTVKDYMQKIGLTKNELGGRWPNLFYLSINKYKRRIKISTANSDTNFNPMNLGKGKKNEIAQNFKI